MTAYSQIKIGALVLVLAALLLFAGCTQPSPIVQTTPAPTATTAAPTVAPAAPSNETLKAEIAALAGTFASETDGNALATVLREGPNSTAFAEMLGHLKAFKESDPKIKYVYTLEQRNGTVRFIVDANYGMPDGSGYLDVYDDAPAELKTPVTVPIGVGPYTDKWGTFYSGYAPVDSGSNESVFVIGVDMTA